MFNTSSASLKPKMVLDNQVRVSTPENIEFQYEVTGPTRRLFAFLADILIAGSIFVTLVILVVVLFGWLSYFLQSTPFAPFLDLIAEIAFGVFLALAFFSLWFYGAYMETYFNGQTWGKMLANIRTLSTNGSAIDGTQATLRNFFRLLDVAPAISLGLIFGPDWGYVPLLPTFGFGLLCMAISPEFQRIGDLVAGTIVVTEEKKWAHGLAKFQDPRVPELAELIPESFVVSSDLARALAEYVDRRIVLPPQRIAEIAGYLGEPLLKVFGLPATTNADLLLCALYYKTFIGSESAGGTDYNPFELKKNLQQSNKAEEAVTASTGANS